MMRASARLLGWLLLARILLVHAAGIAAQPIIVSWGRVDSASTGQQVLTIAEELRKSVIESRKKIGLEDRISAHEVRLAKSGDPNCRDVSNFAYFDSVNLIFFCSDNFAVMHAVMREWTRSIILRDDVLNTQEKIDFFRFLIGYYRGRGVGLTGSWGHCPASYWAFLIRSHKSREDCLKESPVPHWAEYQAFIGSKSNFADQLPDFGELAETGSFDPKSYAAVVKERIEKLPVEARADALYGEIYSGLIYGAVSSIYLHELGHFYGRHGKTGICAVQVEEDSAEAFAGRLISVFSNPDTGKDVYIGNTDLFRMYSAFLLDEYMNSIKGMDQISTPTSVTDLPQELRSLTVVRFAAAMKPLLAKPTFAASLKRTAGEDFDSAEFATSLAKLLAARGCKK